MTLSWTAAKAMRLWFAVVDLRCCQARAMMRRVQWLPDVRVNVRITAESQCIPMLSRWKSRGCAAPSVREVLGSQQLRASAHRGGWLQCFKVRTADQSPSINLRQAVCPSPSFRPVQVMLGGDWLWSMSCRTPVVDLTALDTH